MILYSKEMIDLKLGNIVMLDAHSDAAPDAVVFLSLDTFTQVVRLSERFEDDIDTMIGVLGCKGINSETIKYFYENAPKPLSILAPFFSFAMDVEFPEDMDVLYGVLHQISTFVNFDAFMLYLRFSSNLLEL